MNLTKLKGLEPAAVFGYFEQICAIPHGSGNVDAISDYLVAFAKAHKLRYIQDESKNVIIFRDATPGYEDHAPVILQGHMDMVCQKDADCPIDMDKEGLDITNDGSYVFAKGTTLGGDNGIAVAFMLALLADDTIAHPAIETIFTVDEEIGLLGATAIDVSMLKGRTLINIDSEEEGIFTVSCAGGARFYLELPLERRVVYGPCVRLTVAGLKGGHSGVDIDKSRANANKVMAELLSRIRKVMPICISKIHGGAKDNAIADRCQTTLVTLGLNPEQINEIASTLQAEIREKYDEPQAVIYGDNVEDVFGANALTSEETDKVIALLQALPNGIRKWSPDIAGLVQTSLNLGVLELDQTLEASFSVRSSINSELQQLLAELGDVAQEYGAAHGYDGVYPAWEYRKQSPLRDKMVALYETMFVQKPQVVAIHAGLECGVLAEKLPGLDCISIGPDMYDIHTSRERLSIASTQRTWKFLQEVLKAL